MIIPRFFVLLLCFALLLFKPMQSARAQNAVGTITDSTMVFSLQDFFALVKQYHPVARQSSLLTKQAEAQLLLAKGGFDPQLYSYIEQKSFDNKNYFTLSQSGFKIPTWYGLELKGGYNLQNGLYLNPENKLPDAGQAFAGISVSVLQGMVIDQRRAVLQQARIFTQASEAEKLNLLNNLLFEAAGTYWEWTLAYNHLLLQEQAVQLAQLRLEWVKNTFLQGARPAIDTLEALIQLQNRNFDQNDAQLNYQNATLALSNFLWYENDTPLEITPQIIPPKLNDLPIQTITPDSLNIAAGLLLRQHPQLLQYKFKLADLNVERRLKAEKLKPKLNLNYNLLANGINFLDAGNGNNNGLFLQNYKWGLEFSMPLFLRAERGNLQLTRIKIQETNLQLQQKQLELSNKLQAYYNQLANNQQQINLYTQTVNNYQALANGEETRFRLGESSLFLVNTRESKLIEAQAKLLELKAKHYKILAGVAFAAGVLHNNPF